MLVDYTTTRASVETYLKGNFTLCPIQFENVPLSVTNPEEYIALFDKTDDAITNTLQAESAICKGTLVVQIFTKIGTGTAKARAIGVKLSTLISSKTIGGIDFEHGELFGVPSDPANTYYQHNLTFRYNYIYGEIPDC